jgi:hypothetical protein
MKRNKTVGEKFGFALLAASVASLSAAETSNSDLLSVLQKKGLLTEVEVQSLRDEQKKTSAPAKAPTPNWVANTKISGDFRGRFEGLYASDPSVMDRNRFRFRLRAGLVSQVGEQFEVGLRLASGEAAAGTAGGDPISSNATFMDNGSKKLIFIDLAYAKWREVQSDRWNATLTLGKMENPLVTSDIVFDHDYTPEGIAQQVTWKVDDRHTVSANVAGFALDGIGAFERDAFIAAAQLRLDSKWTKQLQTSGGIMALGIIGEDALVNAAVPNQNRGNSRPRANTFGPGALSQEYTTLVADAAVTYSFASAPLYSGSFPVKFGGDYIYNWGAKTLNQAASIGITFGKAAKKGQWELGYRYKYLEADAWYEELVDSDFGAVYGRAPDAGGSAGYGAGTNVRGHVVKACYAVSDAFALGVTAAFTDLIKSSPANFDSGFTRVQFDATWKF